MLIRPKGHSIEIIQQPIAVRPDDWHISGGLSQSILQIMAFRVHFSKSGGIADSAASAAFSQLFNDGDGLMPVNRNKTRIRCRGQGGDCSIGLFTADLVPGWMYRPDIAIKTEGPAVVNDRDGFSAAKYSD